jgi:phosphoribosylanthranilate isomerase
MSLKTEVKVGNISNLSDARYCAGMGVQYLGFSMDSNSDQYVDQNTLKTIKEWIVGPKIVGEFSKIDPDSQIYSSLEEELDYIEITDPDSIDVAEKTGIPVILKLDITNIKSIPGLSEILDNLNNRVQFFLLDGFPGPEIKNMDILNLSSQYRIMIGFKMDQQSIHAWIDGTNIFGISLKGGTEIKPGFKDYDELADILEEIEVD